ncbi:response regulator [Cohnella sp. CFH 77786]|uniref:response regulator n=1 Tax=Cohnella sp. CFH 77786 TaxID=2662265 RepID=UPI001C60B4C4|nr:response regulator [Cohnella sp. CFH 77786]MBW5444814.1 response regulator [Cohnella sp. CFH 77786]
MNRILIVDDEPLIRSSLSKVIEDLSDIHLVSGTVSNGEEAMDWLGQYYADMCITDVRMPKMDGLELIRRINLQYPWVTCIVVSSYDDFGYVQQSLKLGAADYVLKPVSREALHEAILRTHGKSSESRFDYASRLMLKRLPHHMDMLERWVRQIRTAQYETLPLLVVDTLEMLESWIGGQYHYLSMLAMEWLGLVKEELSKEKLEIELEEGIDSGLGDVTIPHEKLRSYYRLCAVRRLEEGAGRLCETRAAAGDQPTRKAVEAVKRYIDRHYAEKITLQELADEAMVSRNYIAILFKKATGHTIWNYLVSIRMSKARELLLQTHKKVYEIAGDVGYDNSVHFSQLFKEHFGLAPAEYKKRMES